MSTIEVTKHIQESSSRVRSGLVGAYYLLTIATGAFVLLFHGRRAFSVDLMVGILYLVVTAFLYGMSSSANNSTR